jgi:hypothetical protein
VPPSVVSSILADDHAASMAGIASYTLYLLNPKADRPYAYAYDNE